MRRTYTAACHVTLAQHHVTAVKSDNPAHSQLLSAFFVVRSDSQSSFGFARSTKDTQRLSLITSSLRFLHSTF